ncbi:MAG: four helix bundle protein [Verrucomicrobiales bacterium VVV1]|nr:MAG: four helix bundle protein [Verrucomicrobiales bacterium VVV1]
MAEDPTKPATNQSTSKFDLEERTAAFGEAIIEFAMSIKESAVMRPLISQIVRAGTSAGANYCEADDAVSRKEFVLKINTCRKETRETKFWLRMIVKADPNLRDPAAVLWKESNELHLIFSKIRRTTLANSSPTSPPNS